MPGRERPSSEKESVNSEAFSVKKEGAEILNIEELSKRSIQDLVSFAKNLEIKFEDEITRQALIYKIIEHSIGNENIKVIAVGVLEKMNEGYGFLRSPSYNYLPGTDDVYVSPSQIRVHGLKTGDTVSGEVRSPKPNEKYFALFQVKTVNFKPIDEVKERVSFYSLTPCYANSRIKMEVENDPERVANRFIDLFAPIGKGQRGMIVSPPKAGKTMLLKSIANAITTNHPECYLIVLLIDERPEEVTDMKASVKGEVVSSTFDEPAIRHVNVSKMVLEKAKRLTEEKMDVVILLDSLTRLARAYNQVEPTSGKVLSGGVDANALHKPKRFFGAARNIKEGGSLTIIATALIETGSKMDEVIFEEFKGTGNMEVVLSREIAEKRLFPAVNIKKSGTRNEELLLTEEELQKSYILRNVLSTMSEADGLEIVLSKMKITKNNSQFLKIMNSSS